MVLLLGVAGMAVAVVAWRRCIAVKRGRRWGSWLWLVKLVGGGGGGGAGRSWGCCCCWCRLLGLAVVLLVPLTGARGGAAGWGANVKPAWMRSEDGVEWSVCASTEFE